MLSATHISKSFAGIRALADASLEVRAGEVHALVGENGAGKSTLVRVLTGALAPDSGDVTFGGHRVLDARPSAALDASAARREQAPAMRIGSSPRC